MLKNSTDANNPLNCIVKTLSFVTDGRPDVTLDLSGKVYLYRFLVNLIMVSYFKVSLILIISVVF